MSILYITQNGVTSHIGRSQVAPYVLGLARQGFKIHLLSSEPVADPRLVEHYQQLFSDAGVTWTRVPYRNRPPIIGPLLTQWRLRHAARHIVADGEIKLVHCRSFPPAVIGHALKRKFGTKFIFDFRDFYADWGLQHTRGIKWLLYARMKQLEGPMIRAADKVVCLTHRATGVLADWYLDDRPAPARMFQVIPCCADFAHFDSGRVPSAKTVSARERISIDPGKFVMLYLGSLGPDYLLPQMMALFRQILAVKPAACFLFVSNNGQALINAECKAQGIPQEYIRFVSADRNEIPSFIALADLSVVFIRADLSKAGCSPTKLAELFACNVPVIANTGVGDLDAIIDPDRNGSVIVRDFSDETLRAAVETVLAAKQKITTSIRENSREFALEEGVARYAAVYRELLNQ